MTKSPQITIIGLGLIGASLGLALKRSQGRGETTSSFEIMGHDKDNAAMQRARKLGAIDKSHWNLIEACAEADLIVLALPAAGVAPTLEALRQDLRQGVLIMDTTPIKAPVLEAAKTLPEHVLFVGTNPVLAGTPPAAPTADLFQNASWVICPTPSTPADALRVVSDLVSATGAAPFFLDAQEHDGLMAAVEGAPLVLAAALMRLLAGNAAWREFRRLAGGQLEYVTYLPGFEAADLSALVAANRQPIAHWLDALTAEIQVWKAEVLAGEDAAITASFDDALAAREEWLRMRARGEWEPSEPTTQMPGVWQSLLGINKRPRKK